MKKSIFKIDRTKQFIIYGAGGDGIKLSSVLTKGDVNIWGYIDARAESIGYIGNSQVYTLQKAAEIINDKENYIVVLTMKNLFEHSSIARKLAKVGFTQIIYKPAEVLIGIADDDQKRIGETYDQLILQKNVSFGMEIKKTNAELKINCKDNFLIALNENKITAWLPEELIYNYDDLQDAYGCLNMSSFFPLVELYRFFMGQYKEKNKIKEVVDNFIFYSMEWMKKNKINFNNELKKSLIYSRNKVFSEMQRLFEIDQNFFVRNAPSVFRSKNGAFYMSSSGRNRIAFLLARDYRFIPVTMSKSDYQSWINQKIYNEIIEYMQREEIEVLENSIAHPFLSNMPVKYTEYMHLFCVKCLNIILKQLFAQSRVKEENLYVIDKENLRDRKQREKIGCFLLDYGCMSRYLFMNGLSAETITETENNLFTDMERMLDKLFIGHQNKQKTQQIKDYTILIIDSRIQKHLWMKRLNIVYQIFLLNWEGEENCLQDCIKQKFIIQEKLFVSLWDGKQVEGYWMCKEMGEKK